MPEPELKPGGQKDFTVGGETLHVRPIPYGNLKKILRMVFELSGSFAEKSPKNIPDVLDSYLDNVFPLMFKAADHPFLTKEWVENNVDIPTMREIVDAAILVNGIKDFLPKGASPAAPVNASPTPTIQQESRGSTTSSDSPTDGGPAK